MRLLDRRSVRRRPPNDARTWARRFALALGAPLFASPASRVASADPLNPVDLRWAAPARCPSQRVVLDRVRALAGPAAEGRARGPVHADARVEAIHDGRGGFRLTLTVHYGETTGRRVITSLSCEDLVGATAVALSLLLGESTGGSTAASAGAAPSGDSTSAPQSHPPSPAPASAASGSASASGTAPAPASADAPHGAPASAGSLDHTDALPVKRLPPPSAAATSRRWHVDVRAPGLLVDVGSFPRASVGLGAGASFRYDAYRLAVGGALWLGESANNDNGPSPAGADFERWSLDVAGCRAWPAGPFEVAPCVSLAFEDVSARGTGPQVNPVSTQTSWLSVGTGVLGSLRLTEYAALILGVSARWATSQPRFIVAGLGDLYQVSPISAEALLGCDWIL